MVPGLLVLMAACGGGGSGGDAGGGTLLPLQAGALEFGAIVVGGTSSRQMSSSKPIAGLDSADPHSGPYLFERNVPSVLLVGGNLRPMCPGISPPSRCPIPIGPTRSSWGREARMTGEALG